MKYLTALIILLISSLIYYGCSQNNNPTTPSTNTGVLKIMMIDSPADYSEVNIVIDSVQAHISTSDSTSGWFTLNNKPTTYNLLELVNGVNAVIGEANLPVGYYSQIRLFLGSGCNILMGGSRYNLSIPSGSQSGLKLNVDATIQEGIAYLLTLDFDANRSIVHAGNSGKYLLKPVIRVVTTGTTGIITGSVSPDSVSADIWAIEGTDSVSTSTDATGSFKLLYLQPNTYSVFIAPNDTAYKETTMADINVTASNTTNIGTIIISHK